MALANRAAWHPGRVPPEKPDSRESPRNAARATFLRNIFHAALPAAVDQSLAHVYEEAQYFSYRKISKMKRSAPARVKEKTDKKSLDEAFGSRVKRLRQKAGLTLQQLSEKASLAPSTISKVENNQISPTYENILRLADGLNVDIAELFAQGASVMASGRRSITRAGQGAKLESPQYKYEMLCADLSKKKFIPLITKLRAHSLNEFPNLLHHAGEEFIYVLAGEVVVHTDHYEPLLLRIGDSCYFDSNMGHALVAAQEAEAMVLWVCSTLVTDPNELHFPQVNFFPKKQS
jgi:transcriptional regulator with XRE-family HTH domain